jgi:prepilin-type N-terminal cleavage/methylation domain-containing protein
MRTLRGLRPPRSEAGFTLIEMMVSLSIFMIVLFGVYVVYDTGEAQYSRTSREWDAQSQARLALERMAREIRMAGYNSPTNVANPIVIATNDTISIQANVGNGLQYVTYGLRNCDSTTTKTLYRDASTTTYCGGEPFIDGVTSLTFTYYEQTGLSIPSPLTSTYQLDGVNYLTGTSTPDISTMTNRKKINQVKITMTVLQTVGSITTPYTITTDVTLRNFLP